MCLKVCYISSYETELTLPQLTGPIADSQMECMHHSLPIQRLFNTVCLEPAFLLKLFWLRNYPDESTAKLCALTGIFKESGITPLKNGTC